MTTTTTSNMGLINPVQGSSEQASVWTSVIPNNVKIDSHDHASGNGVAIKRLQSGTQASRPSAGIAGQPYIATDSSRIFFDTGTSWLEPLLQNTTLGITIVGGGVTVQAGGLVVSAGGAQFTAGNVGVGRVPSISGGLVVAGTLGAGVNQYGILSQSTAGSDATGIFAAVQAMPRTAAAVFTVGQVIGFYAQNPDKGVGSIITSAYGMLIDGVSVGGTNNYGIYVNAPSGASTINCGIWNRGGLVLDNIAPVSNGGNGTVSFTTNYGNIGANAGAGGALPATVQGYLQIYVGGISVKFPYYAN